MFGCLIFFVHSMLVHWNVVVCSLVNFFCTHTPIFLVQDTNVVRFAGQRLHTAIQGGWIVWFDSQATAREVATWNYAIFAGMHDDLQISSYLACTYRVLLLECIMNTHGQSFVLCWMG